MIANRFELGNGMAKSDFAHILATGATLQIGTNEDGVKKTAVALLAELDDPSIHLIDLAELPLTGALAFGTEQIPGGVIAIGFAPGKDQFDVAQIDALAADLNEKFADVDTVVDPFQLLPQELINDRVIRLYGVVNGSLIPIHEDKNILGVTAVKLKDDSFQFAIAVAGKDEYTTDVYRLDPVTGTIKDLRVTIHGGQVKHLESSMTGTVWATLSDGTVRVIPRFFLPVPKVHANVLTSARNVRKTKFVDGKLLLLGKGKDAVRMIDAELKLVDVSVQLPSKFELDNVVTVGLSGNRPVVVQRGTNKAAVVEALPRLRPISFATAISA